MRPEGAVTDSSSYLIDIRYLIDSYLNYQKQQILTFKKSEPANVWQVCLMNDIQH